MAMGGQQGQCALGIAGFERAGDSRVLAEDLGGALVLTRRGGAPVGQRAVGLKGVPQLTREAQQPLVPAAIQQGEVKGAGRPERWLPGWPASPASRSPTRWLSVPRTSCWTGLAAR